MNIPVYTPKFSCADYCGTIIDSNLMDRGYVEINILSPLNPENVFHFCNWSCWTEEKPENVYTDIDVIGHGLVVKDPITGVYHLALSVGWFSGTKEDVVNYIEKHKDEIIWGEEEEAK